MIVDTLTPDQTWTVWPSETKLGTFVDSSAGQTVTKIVATLCDGIEAIIADAELIISSDFALFKSSLTSLMDSLNSYKAQNDAGIPGYVSKFQNWFIIILRRL